MVFSPKVSGTQNGGFPVPEISLFGWWGFPIDKPYPYSLHRFLYLHFRPEIFWWSLDFQGEAFGKRNSGRCWCPHDVVQILSVGVSDTPKFCVLTHWLLLAWHILYYQMGWFNHHLVISWGTLSTRSSFDVVMGVAPQAVLHWWVSPKN